MPSATTNTTETITELLMHLVRFPTITSDHATNRAALDWVELQLDGLPLHVKRYEHFGFPALVATTKNTKNPRLWLSAHIDVVPDVPAAFNPRIEDERLYGRGTHDMKFAIATFMALLQELGTELSKYDLGLMITSDEEVGGYNGVQWLLDDHGYRGNAALIPDCNGNWTMEMGSKGIMWLELTSSGQTAHASKTWDGVNAIDELNAFVANLRTHLPTEPCGDPDHAHTTINFASVSGGDATNAVPDKASARLDIRFQPDLTTSDVRDWIEDAKLAVPVVQTKELLSDPPYKILHDGPTTDFEQIVHEVTGHGVTLATAHGSSDARHFARHRIPTVNITPTGGGFHVPDEWIDLDDLALFYEVVRRFTAIWAGPKT